MSINESLWLTHIPHRKIAYALLYLGLVLATISILFISTHSAATYAGMFFILLSAAYLSLRIYQSGFRLHSALFFMSLMGICGISIASLMWYQIHVAPYGM